MLQSLFRSSVAKATYYQTTFRSLSSFKMINIEETDKGYYIMDLNRKPVNSLNLELLQEMNIAIKELEADKKCRGAIITSKLPAFSAGLDLFEMYEPKLDRMEAFWREVQNMKFNYFGSPLVLMAAINGPCPAGGCMIAFSCDYRLFAEGKHTMGLNETQIGIAAPYWLAESMKLLTGHREAERLLALSILMKPQEALAKGIVDEVVAPGELMERTKQVMEKWLTIPDIGRIQTKMQLRKYFLEELEQRREEDLQSFIKGITNPKLQQLLGVYIQQLKQK